MTDTSEDSKPTNNNLLKIIGAISLAVLGFVIYTSVQTNPVSNTPTTDLTPPPVLEKEIELSKDNIKPNNPIQPQPVIEQPSRNQPETKTPAPNASQVEPSNWNNPTPPTTQQPTPEKKPTVTVDTKKTTPTSFYEKKLESYYGMTPSTGKKYIAIYLIGVGFSADQLKYIKEKLPNTVTLGISDTSFGKEIVQLYKQGFELMGELPPLSNLFVSDKVKLNSISRVNAAYTKSLFNGSMGMAVYYPNNYLDNTPYYQELINQAKTKKVLFFDFAKNKATNNGMQEDLYYLKSSLQIDVTQDKNSLNNALLTLENTAQQNGFAVGVALSIPPSMDVLVEWIKTLESKNIQLVPLSRLAFLKYQQSDNVNVLKPKLTIVE